MVSSPGAIAARAKARGMVYGKHAESDKNDDTYDNRTKMQQNQVLEIYAV
jgi:hypothetical protein